MMYGNYNEGGYGAGGYGAGGGYSGNYGRRGVPGTGRGRGRYRGGYSGPEKSLEEMQEHYGNYSESRGAAESGNYGAEKDSMMALEYMLEAVVDFIGMLSKEAGSQEEAQMIKKYTRKIGEM
ncbi:MAG: hypothetical protein IKB64_00885 [Paludibacteraceae bacterium]|nr:hypothetical protein [Paludibacteraceae bacterium]